VSVQLHPPHVGDLMTDASLIRKMAGALGERRALEDLDAPRVSAVDEVLLQKAGRADPALLGIAAPLCPKSPLAPSEHLAAPTPAYEDRGGTSPGGGREE